jgi:hypothetical protein
MRDEDGDYHLIKQRPAGAARDVLDVPGMTEGPSDEEVDIIRLDPAQDLLTDWQAEVQLIVDCCVNADPFQMGHHIICRDDADLIAVQRDHVDGLCFAQEGDGIVHGTTGFATSIPSDKDSRSNIFRRCRDRNAEHRPPAFDHQFLDIDGTFFRIGIVDIAKVICAAAARAGAAFGANGGPAGMTGLLVGADAPSREVTKACHSARDAAARRLVNISLE